MNIDRWVIRVLFEVEVEDSAFTFFFPFYIIFHIPVKTRYFSEKNPPQNSQATPITLMIIQNALSSSHPTLRAVNHKSSVCSSNQGSQCILKMQ